MPELTVDPRAYIRPSPARGHLGRFYCIPQRAYIRPSPARGQLGRFYCRPQSLHQTQSCSRSFRQVLLYTPELILDLVLPAVIQVGSTVYLIAYIRPSPARGHLGRFYCRPQSLYQTQSCLRSFRQVLLQTLELILDLVLVAVIQVGSTVDPRVYIRPSSACGHLGRFCCRPYCILRK